MLVVKKLPVSTGGELEAHLHPKDALALGAHSGDSVHIFVGPLEVFARVELNSSQKQGVVGLVKETIKELMGGTRTFPRGKASVRLADKPESLALIHKKLDGKTLSPEELDIVDADIVDYALNDVEVCYFISACYMVGLTMNETIALTESMVLHGETLGIGNERFGGRGEIVLDKHCIGGVPGNRTSLAIIPIMVALGYTIPKTSSRSITSPSGTADTVEVLANVELTMEEARKVIKKAGGCVIWGGGTNVAPSDDRMIHIRHSMHLDPEGLLLSSVMAKKAAMGSNVVLIDIPYGPQAKVANKKEAGALGKKFKKIGEGLGMKMKVTLSPGLQAGGYGVGPALEMKDVLLLLSGDSAAPRDYFNHAIDLASELLMLESGMKKREALEECKRVVLDGSALDAFYAMMRLQGLKFTCTKRNFLQKAHAHLDSLIGTHVHEVRSEKGGVLKSWDIKGLASVAFVAGSPADQGAGVQAFSKIGDRISEGDVIMKIYSNSKDRLGFAIREYESKALFDIR